MVLVAVGAGVGVLYGLFGAGGSAFATPLLAALGVPPVMAVASPLPATIPAALAGGWSYARSGQLDRRVAGRAIAGGVPAAVVGALASSRVGGTTLLVLSGLVVLLLGARLVAPVRARAAGATLSVDDRLPIVAPAAAGVGFATGLLANSGGFLLVPLFLLVVGLGMRTAAGTSLVVAAALSVPTLLTHWALGSIDWGVAGLFAVGLLPGSILGSRLSQHLPQGRTQRVFGMVLTVFAVWFLARLALP